MAAPSPLDLLKRQTELLQEVSNQEQANLKLLDEIMQVQLDSLEAQRKIARTAVLFFWLVVVNLFLISLPVLYWLVYWFRTSVLR